MRYKQFNGIQIDHALGVSPVGDDTLLIARYAAKLKATHVLDVGTGTGFIPIYLATVGRICTGADINEYAIRCAQRNAKKNNISCTFCKSDLFKDVNGTFDLITFNPPFGNTSSPYLTKIVEIVKSLIPKDNDIFIAVSYLLIKKQRMKLIKRFLKESPLSLRPHGNILILLYKTEVPLVRHLTHTIVGKYKDFSLMQLSV